MVQNQASSTITLVPLGTSFLHGSLISDELLHTLSVTKNLHQKSLLLYNRRGSGRAWICQDCGYFPLCPHCDIALAHHTTPRKQLICHQCNHTENLLFDCPKCSGVRFDSIGIGIQKIASDLHNLLPDFHLLRLDSDAEIDKFQILHSLQDVDIILGTHSHLSLLHQKDISQIVFLLFESDLTLPDYRMEEEVYHTLEYAKKSGKDILIQTYTPNSPLLSLIIEGNYKDFLREMSRERDKYHYPPYAQFGLIRIRDPQKAKVQDIVAKLVNKITLLKGDDVFMAFDKDIWEKYAGEWVQKIILKGKNLEPILSNLEVEIIRNRSITLEWR